ncbi:MAG: methyltransferase domain-containing protein [Marinoscillum sp.]|uniref:class I SAM-dependent methyltransferase n=1 Tax=Marinoscillum sp. TaxID=2024838 RepID=UPI0032F2A8A7
MTREKWSKELIIGELERLAPFHHNIELPYGLSTYIPEKAKRSIEESRFPNLIKHAFPTLLNEFGGTLEGKRVLDLACNCGGFAIEASKLGAKQVLGIDLVEHYITQANFLKDILGIPNVDFEVMDINSIDVKLTDQFDITFCFGILYHFENPVSVMRKICEQTKDAIFIDTSVLKTPRYLKYLYNKPVWLMNFPTKSDQSDLISSTSLWRTQKQAQFLPNEEAVVQLLKYLGFSKITRIKPNQKGLEKRYYKGTRISLLARRH